MAKSEVKVTRKKLSDYQFDPANPNKGTPKGQAALEHSVGKFGPARSGVADKTGVIRAGNHTAEQLFAAGIEEVLEVETNGKQWVVVKRVDMDETLGKQYAIADNRTGEFIAWDTDVLAGMVGEGIDLTQFWSEDEIQGLLHQEVPSLEDLEQEFGDHDDRTFWPVIRVQVSPETESAYKSLMATLPGNDEAEKFDALVSLARDAKSGQ